MICINFKYPVPKDAIENTYPWSKISSASDWTIFVPTRQNISFGQYLTVAKDKKKRCGESSEHRAVEKQTFQWMRHQEKQIDRKNGMESYSQISKNGNVTKAETSSGYISTEIVTRDNDQNFSKIENLFHNTKLYSLLCTQHNTMYSM